MGIKEFYAYVLYLLKHHCPIKLKTTNTAFPKSLLKLSFVYQFPRHSTPLLSARICSMKNSSQAKEYNTYRTKATKAFKTPPIFPWIFSFLSDVFPRKADRRKNLHRAMHVYQRAKFCFLPDALFAVEQYRAATLLYSRQNGNFVRPLEQKKKKR